MSIKIMTTKSLQGTAQNYDYGYSSHSSISSSSISTKKPAKPALWQEGQNTWPTTNQPHYQQNTVNDYETATPSFPDPSGYLGVDAPKPSPTTTELSNASSYISYLVEQLNSAKDKLEKAEEKIKILEGKDDSFQQYKEYLISSIDRFLAERASTEIGTITGKEIFKEATE